MTTRGHSIRSIRSAGRSRVLGTAAVAAALALALAGCSSPGTSAASPSTGASASATGPTGKITVFAAASLQQTFTKLGSTYEKAHPGTSVTFSFGGSSDLVTQIQNGAPADVFASADTTNMDKLTDTDLRAGSPRTFAKNVLEVAVAPGNPHKITRFADLADQGLQVVVCAAPVPCGAATQTVEHDNGITLHPVSEEQSVTDVLGKVEAGQADAGVVYVTDVKGAGGKVDGVPLRVSHNTVNTYPIGVLKESQNPTLAESFMDYVRSSDGQAVLQAAGFRKP